MKEQLSLFSDIHPGEGIGSIRLGDDISDLFPAIFELPYSAVKVEAFYPRIFQYTIEESLDLMFDVLTKRLIRIELYNNFQGKVINSEVSIGSNLQSIEQLGLPLSEDEGYLLAGEQSELVFLLKSPDEEATEKTVTRIIIEMLGWQVP